MTLNQEEYNALCKVVDIYHDTELKHYEESKSSNHIWHDINTLSLFLKNIQMKGEQDAT